MPVADVAALKRAVMTLEGLVRGRSEGSPRMTSARAVREPGA